MENPSRSVWVVPGAILFAGILLAVAVYSYRIKDVEIPDGGDPSVVSPVTPADHIVGNPEAPVRIVEYSDIDSEHGKALQATLAQLMTEYAPGGQVAWVYRHFPLTTVHANSLRHALAAECAASLGGEHAFWRFIDLVNAMAPGSAEFDPKDYPDIVGRLGIDEGAFTGCLTSGRFAGKVRAEAHNALEAGAEGAPFTVILVGGGEPISINGSLPYDAMKQAIEKALREAE